MAITVTLGFTYAVVRNSLILGGMGLAARNPNYFNFLIPPILNGLLFRETAKSSLSLQ